MSYSVGLAILPPKQSVRIHSKDWRNRARGTLARSPCRSPFGLTSPTIHACGSASLFHTRYCHSHQKQEVSAPLHQCQHHLVVISLSKSACSCSDSNTSASRRLRSLEHCNTPTSARTDVPPVRARCNEGVMKLLFWQLSQQHAQKDWRCRKRGAQAT
jgi:hypothetical protein